MNIINLTPHALNIKLSNGETLTVPPSGVVARCDQTKKIVNRLSGDFHPDDAPHIVVRQTKFGDVSGIPEPEVGTVYVASMLAAQAANRQDVFFPGEAVRDDKGNIIGCDGLSAF